METKYFMKSISPNFVKEFIKEMKNLGKEELEGVKRCIENDSHVTYGERCRSGFVDVIHSDEAICVYMMADKLLEKYV